MRAVYFGSVCGRVRDALVSAACGSTDSADPDALTGTEWTLTQSSVSSVDLGAAGITATFDGERVSGFSGVNQYGGPYSAGDDGSLEVGDLAGTLMAGPEPLMRAEQMYLDLLRKCTSYKVENDDADAGHRRRRRRSSTRRSPPLSSPAPRGP